MIERMAWIAARLRKGQRITATSVSTKFEVSQKTIVRDMDFMRDRLRYDFHFCSSTNTWVLDRAPDPIL
jgi:hypothetical protein